MLLVFIKLWTSLSQRAPPRDLHLNRSKCLLSLPQGLNLPPNPLPPEIPVSTSGFVLLGSPIGPPAFLSSSLSNLISKLERMLSLLPSLRDAQMETTLLRHCFSLSKLSVFLRTSNPVPLISLYESFASLMLSSLSKCISAHISQWSWLKASLPVSMGGVDLRKAAVHSSVAYYSSLYNSASILQEVLGYSPNLSPLLDSCCPLLSKHAARPDWSSHLSIDSPISQRLLSTSIDKASFSSLLSQAPHIRSRALALSSSIPHAGDWLSVVPSHQLGLYFLDQEFRVCVQYWFGFSAFYPSLDLYALSLLILMVITRWNVVVIVTSFDVMTLVIFAAAQSAALAPQKEMPSLIPGSCARPADIFLSQWDGGRPVALDVTVISSLLLLMLLSSRALL